MSGSVALPFTAASEIRSLGDGTFTAELRAEWSVGSHPHGGFLLALLAKAALARLAEAGEPPAEPLAVSADYLRPPAIGPALLRTDIRKVGRRTSVLEVRLEQRSRSCVEARVTAGRLPTKRPEWTDVPEVAAQPPAGAIHFAGDVDEGAPNLAQGCDVRLDPSTLTDHDGGPDAPPRMRLWVRPRDGEPDPLFTLLAGDINPPVVFNRGRKGWVPTAQLTALLRARPAPGWLRVYVDCRTLQEAWFDSDATVIDSAGRLVCQARQLALAPAP